MAQDDYDYPEDEFDVLGNDRTPAAVHRAPRPWWRVWGPLIAVVVLAPVIAYGLVSLGTGGDTDPEPVATSTEQPAETEAPPEGEEGTAPTEEESTPVEEETTPEEPEAPPIDRSVEVRVLNGAAVSGLAGRVSETVSGDGWTTVVAGNYTSPQPQVSTIFYNNADLLDEAQALGELLGIEPITELADVPAVTVVLRPDFEE